MRTQKPGRLTNLLGWGVGAFGVLALLAGCGPSGGSVARSSPGATQTASSGSTGQASACQGSDPAASVRAASAAQDSAGSYELDTTSTTQLGNSHLTLQVQHPDRFHFTSVAPDGRTSEFLAIGSSTWTKSNGTWTAAPGLNLASLMQQAGPLGESMLSDTAFTGASVDPHTTLGGQAAVLHKFHMSIPSAQLSSDVQLWLASATCRPLQAIDSFTEVINGATSTGRSTTSWSDWNAVSIEPPV